MWQTPQRCGQNEQMFFDIRVHLPPGTAQSPQRVSNLETNLPNFAHLLGDLANGVHFNRISLRGANERISSKVRNNYNMLLRSPPDILSSLFQLISHS